MSGTGRARSVTAESSPEAAKTGPGPAQVRLLFRFVFLSLWVMPILGFTMPREAMTQSWEPLDLVKLVVLASVCLGGMYALQANLSHPQIRGIIDPLLPFYLFFAWALFSTLWSPLRSATIYQSGGIAAMLFFATSVGLICTQQSGVSKVLLHLNLILLASSGVVLAAYLIDPTVSGLDRNRIHSGGDGIIHPTAAGATASLGLLLPILCHVIGGFGWARKLLAPSLIVHGSVVLLSNSRTATGLAVITIGFVLFWFSSNRSRAKVAAGIGVVCFAMVLADPGFKLWQSAVGASAQYVTRGQSGDQLKGVSGRSEMWSMIWNEYEKSLLCGHGFSVTSEKGTFLVWDIQANHTAHNMILQVLVSTGAIGLLIFGFALLQILFAWLILRRGNRFQQRLFTILAVTSFWYLGWAQLGVSFMGPVRPESIMFFTLVGVGIGQATMVKRARQTPSMVAA